MKLLVHVVIHFKIIISIYVNRYKLYQEATGYCVEKLEWVAITRTFGCKTEIKPLFNRVEPNGSRLTEDQALIAY